MERFNVNYYSNNDGTSTLEVKCKFFYSDICLSDDEVPHIDNLANFIKSMLLDYTDKPIRDYKDFPKFFAFDRIVFGNEYYHVVTIDSIGFAKIAPVQYKTLETAIDGARNLSKFVEKCAKNFFEN